MNRKASDISTAKAQQARAGGHAHESSCGHGEHAHCSKEGKPHEDDAVRHVGERRSTRQRAAIRAAMAAEGRPMSPPEILEVAQQHVSRIGIATVYRNIKAMAESGEVVPVALPGDRLYYELAHKAHEHHHHFRCNHCERVFDIEGCVEDFRAMLPAGFSVAAHDLTLYGMCAECAAKTSKPSAGPS